MGNSGISRARAQQLLVEVITAHLPGEQRLIERIGRGTVSAEERDAVCQAITREFAAAGLGADDEPTARGRELEALLDDLNRPNLGRR